MKKLFPNTGQNQKFNRPGGSFSTIIILLWRIIKNNKILFFSCSLLAFSTAVINFVANLILDKLIFDQEVTDQVKIEELNFSFPFLERLGKFGPVKYILWAILYMSIAKGTFSIVHWYTVNYGASRIEKDLKTELFEVLTNSTYENSSEVSAKMLTQFSSDIDSIANDIWIIPNKFIYTLTSLSFNLVFNFKRGGKFKTSLLLVLTSLFIILFGVIWLLLRKSIKLGTEAKRRYERDNLFIFERISNLEYIKGSSSEELEKTKLDAHLDDTFRKNKLSLFWTALFRTVPEYIMIPNIPLLFLLIVTFFKSFRGQIDSALDLAYNFNIVRRLNSEISKITTSFLSFEDLLSNLSVVMDNVNLLTKEEEDLVHEESKFSIKKNITFNKVTFAYPSRPQINVIENFSFSFDNDKKYGIAGKNGIGKSTITKIILKLYKVYNGNVSIGNEDISNINTVSLHRNICRLNNRPAFFNMSIAENVFYPFSYNKSKDLKKLVLAAKEARIISFINSLPNGFDTVLREGGADLSEGQKQQLEAMKVFIRDYEIYIFDEILSNVHPLARKAILVNIFTKIKNKLVIAIDHQYDIFTHMDYVYAFSSKKLTRVRNRKLLDT